MAAVRIVIALLFGQSWDFTQEDMLDPTTNIEGWNGKESWTFRTKKNAPSADLYHKIVVVETSPLCKG